MRTQKSIVPTELQHHEGRTGGTYVVTTRCQRWGRGDTLDEAMRQARKAGARSLVGKNVVIAWQPDSAWQKVKAEFGDKTQAQKPYIDGNGAMCSWGAIGSVERLHQPRKK